MRDTGKTVAGLPLYPHPDCPPDTAYVIPRTDFVAMLDQAIRDTYIPALQAQLSQSGTGLLGLINSGQHWPLSPEEIAARNERWARANREREAEWEAHRLHIEKVKAIFADLPERVRERLLDDLDPYDCDD